VKLKVKCVIKLYKAVTVEDFGRKPNCSFAKMSLPSTRSINLLNIIFSKTLENAVKI
jgi:hypothetical protein